MSKKTRKGLPGQPRLYETVIVVDPQIGDDAIRQIVEKTKEVITGAGGQLVKVDEWGKRKLAYTIHKKTYGYYACFEFEHTGEVVKLLTDYFHITENILRSLTVLVDSRLKAERAREMAKLKEAAAEEPAAAAV